MWRAIYWFPNGGAGLANQMDTYVDGKFAHLVDPKNGYPIRDCKDARHRRLLEFIVPVIHPDKPTRVTITIGNTIFGALDGCRPVDWGQVFRNLVKRLVTRAKKAKPTPIFSFLFHWYHNQGLLIGEEETNYRAAQKLTNYRITPDPEPESNPVSRGVEIRIPEQLT